MKHRTDFIERDEYLESDLYLSETYFCTTQKRLYVTKNTKKKKIEKVVNLNTVQSVSIEAGREKRSLVPLLMGLIIAGASVPFYFNEAQKPVFMALLFIGVMLTIIGIIVRLPRYYSEIIISSFGYKIHIHCEKITASQEQKLKKMLYSTLVSRSEQGNTVFEKETTEIPEVEVTEIPSVGETGTEQTGTENAVQNVNA